MQFAKEFAKQRSLLLPREKHRVHSVECKIREIEARPAPPPSFPAKSCPFRQLPMTQPGRDYSRKRVLEGRGCREHVEDVCSLSCPSIHRALTELRVYERFCFTQIVGRWCDVVLGTQLV